MFQVCLRFVSGRNTEVVRHRALAQTSELREHKPHPMTLLAALPQLGAYLLKDGILCIHKPFEIKRVVHGAKVTSIASLKQCFFRDSSQLVRPRQHSSMRRSSSRQKHAGTRSQEN